MKATLFHKSADLLAIVSAKINKIETFMTLAS